MEMKERIYLDNNATTQLDPRVFQAMLLELTGPPANPSSVHAFGQRAKGLLAAARGKVAHYFKAKPEEILFTSGGTEGINYFLKPLKGHIITSSIEHSAIHKTLQKKELEGVEVTYLSPGLKGAVLLAQVEEAIKANTSAIILSSANAETGVKIDLKAISELAEGKGIPLFIDAVAILGKEPFTLYPGITALAFSAHKFHGPKGVGGLYLRGSTKWPAEMTGGAQEMNRRAGTENLAGILGLAEAIEILKETEISISQKLFFLREKLEEGLIREIPDILIHGTGDRVSNTSNIAFLGCDGETLLMQLDLAGIAVSLGSACSSGALEPSRVLLNMGIARKVARSSIRFSLSRMNTLDEIEKTIAITSQIVKHLRRISI